MPNDTQDQGSKARTRRVRDFFYHLVVYVFALVFLFLVMGANSAFVVMVLCWGFAVALHGVYAYFG